MSKTNEVVKSLGSFETLAGIVEYIDGEEWEYKLERKDLLTSLSVDLFDGTLILRSDGSWSLV